MLLLEDYRNGRFPAGRTVRRVNGTGPATDIRLHGVGIGFSVTRAVWSVAVDSWDRVSFPVRYGNRGRGDFVSFSRVRRVQFTRYHLPLRPETTGLYQIFTADFEGSRNPI